MQNSKWYQFSNIGYFAIITGQFHFSPTLEIIENLTHERLNLFLEESKCFYPHQFGFRLNRSTNNALMSIIENVQARLDDIEFAAGVFVGIPEKWDLRAGTPRCDPRPHKWDPGRGTPISSSGTWDPGPLKWDPGP